MTALIDFADERTTIVTVNRRLARGLLTEHGERAVADGQGAWRTPDILPYAAFVRRAWRDYRVAADSPQAVLLSDAQERLTWESVIRAALIPSGVEGEFSAVIAARQVQVAFSLLNAWHIDVDDGDFGRNEDSRAFRSWTRAFVQHCADGHWIDAGRAANVLVSGKDFLADTCGERIVFAGFDVLTAQQRKLIDAFRAAGVEVVVAKAQGSRGVAQRYTFEDTTSELTTSCTAW